MQTRSRFLTNSFLKHFNQTFKTFAHKNLVFFRKAVLCPKLILMHFLPPLQMIICLILIAILQDG